MGKLHSLCLLEATFLVALSAAWPQLNLSHHNRLLCALLLVYSCAANAVAFLVTTLAGVGAGVFDAVAACTLHGHSAVWTWSAYLLFNSVDLAIAAVPALLFGTLCPRQPPNSPPSSLSSCERPGGRAQIVCTGATFLACIAVLAANVALPIGKDAPSPAEEGGGGGLACPFALRHR